MRELKQAEMHQVAGGWFFCVKKSWSLSWSKCSKKTQTKPDCSQEKPEPVPAPPPLFT